MTTATTLDTIASQHGGDFFTAMDPGSAGVYQERVYRFPVVRDGRSFWLAAKAELGGRLLAGRQAEFAGTTSAWVTVTVHN